MSMHSKTTTVAGDTKFRPPTDTTAERLVTKHAKPPTDTQKAPPSDGHRQVTADVLEQTAVERGEQLNEATSESPADAQQQAVRVQEQTSTEPAEQTSEAKGKPRSGPLHQTEKGEVDKSRSPSLAKTLGSRIARSRFGVQTVIPLFIAALAGGTYFAWWHALPKIIEWSNEVGWRWAIGWLGVFFSAFAPVYIVMLVGPIVGETLSAADERNEVQALDDLDHVEQEIRGSSEPVDFARYSRKALKAYYHMGQSQVRVSFYIGVFAMVFGFVFLLTGLLVQILDLSKVPYVRANPAVETVALGGGLIIEFIAATFLWIYRASIVQLNRYYRRQMLVHSALLSVTLTGRMRDSERGPVIASIVKILTGPDVEVAFPGLPRPRERENAPPEKSPNSAAGTAA